MSETVEYGNAEGGAALPESGLIENMGMLDLRSAKTAEELKHITALKNIGCVVIPEHLATALMSVPMENVGTIVPVPEGENVKLHVGQSKMSGEALAAGGAEDILFVAGQLFITTPVTNVGFKEIRVHGQVMAIRGSETPLGAKIGQITGQILYLPAKTRTVMGEETIGKAFLELLPEPTALVVMGKLTFEDDVTAELLQSKILEIVLMGEIHTPAALLPLTQVLTIEKMGEIHVKK